MERRWDSRIERYLGVEVSHQGRILGRYVSRNASLGGMFLDSWGLDLCRNDVVDLRLDVRGALQSIRALVTHHSQRGIGLQLMDHNPDYHRSVHPSAHLGDTRRPSTRRRGTVVAEAGDGACSIEIIETWPATERAPASTALRLQMGEQLDGSAFVQICEARQLLSEETVDQVLVDLAATRYVLDSGLAMLLALRAQAGDVQDHIYLLNCSPKVRSRLAAVRLELQFFVG